MGHYGFVKNAWVAFKGNSLSESQLKLLKLIEKTNLVDNCYDVDEDCVSVKYNYTVSGKNKPDEDYKYVICVCISDKCRGNFCFNASGVMVNYLKALAEVATLLPEYQVGNYKYVCECDSDFADEE